MQIKLTPNSGLTAMPPDRERKQSLIASLFVFVISFAWFLFWLFDQSFFDDDYTQWLIPVEGLTFSDIIRQVVTLIPPNWGFRDRPVLLLFFKCGRAMFGANPFCYFLVKSLIGASLSTSIFALTNLMAHRKGKASDTTIDRLLTFVPSLLFISAEPVFVSMLWLCDMEVLSQLCLVGALALYLYYRKSEWHQVRLRPRSVILQVLIFCLVFVGFKTKASTKIFPLIIIFHMLLFDRKSIRHFAILMASLVFVCIPWTSLSRHPLPEFLSTSSYDSILGYYWHPASLDCFVRFLVGDVKALWPFSEGQFRPYGILQVLSPFGILTTIGAGCLLMRKHGFSIRSGRTHEHDSLATVLIPWLLFSIGLLTIYPNVVAQFMSRYLVAVVIPVFIMMGLLVRLARPYTSRMIFVALLTGLFMQMIAGVCQMRLRKAHEGALLILADKTRAHLETNYRDANIAYMLQPMLAYWPPGHGNRYVSISDLNKENVRLLDLLAEENRPLYLVTSESQSNRYWRFCGKMELADSLHNEITGSLLHRKTKYIYQFIK